MTRTLLTIGTIVTILTLSQPSPAVPVEPVDPVIVVETEFGIATISGPAAEYVLQSAFPVNLGESL